MYWTWLLLPEPIPGVSFMCKSDMSRGKSLFHLAQHYDMFFWTHHSPPTHHHHNIPFPFSKGPVLLLLCLVGFGAAVLAHLFCMCCWPVCPWRRGEMRMGHRWTMHKYALLSTPNLFKRNQSRIVPARNWRLFKKRYEIQIGQVEIKWDLTVIERCCIILDQKLFCVSNIKIKFCACAGRL